MNGNEIKGTTLNDKKQGTREHVVEVTDEFLEAGKKLANEVYREGLNKIDETQEEIKLYGDKLLRKIQENPLQSLLIAVGAGFLFSLLLKK